jgi:hypothetical protein
MTVKVMTKVADNPWLQMKGDTSRRVDIETKHDFFWIMDIKNRYGLLIKFDFPLTNIEILNKVKGIFIVTSSNGNSGNLYFLLNSNSDWEIFLLVCTDLISMASKCQDENSMIPVINQRIKRWQKFLSENNSVSMPETLQMGLLTELYCLFHFLIPNFHYREAVSSWVGPDSDKKDFSLADFFIEVKSFISSKGRIIKISSLQQLDYEIKPLFLLAFGLTRSENGLSVVDLISSINNSIPEEDNQIRDIFETRLAAYGYIESVTEPPFYTYTIDFNKSYLVTKNFPTISASSIDSRILTVQYALDLAKCESCEALLPFNI